MESTKIKKIFLPIVIVLAVLTVAFIALTVVVKVTGGHPSSASSQKAKESTEVEAESNEVSYVSNYKLSGYSSSGTSDAKEDTTVSDKLSDTEGYILPTSDTVQLTDADLAGLSAQELTYARNEIYARHGYVFESPELNDYFAQKSWYTADATFTQEAASAQEQANADFIKQYQETNNLGYEVQKK